MNTGIATTSKLATANSRSSQGVKELRHDSDGAQRRAKEHKKQGSDDLISKINRALQNEDAATAKNLLKRTTLSALAISALGECLCNAPETATPQILDVINYLACRANLEAAQAHKPDIVWKNIKKIIRKKDLKTASDNIATEMTSLYSLACERLKELCVQSLEDTKVKVEDTAMARTGVSVSTVPRSKSSEKEKPKARGKGFPFREKEDVKEGYKSRKSTARAPANSIKRKEELSIPTQTVRVAEIKQHEAGSPISLKRSLSESSDESDQRSPKRPATVRYSISCDRVKEDPYTPSAPSLFPALDKNESEPLSGEERHEAMVNHLVRIDCSVARCLTIESSAQLSHRLAVLQVSLMVLFTQELDKQIVLLSRKGCQSTIEDIQRLFHMVGAVKHNTADDVSSSSDEDNEVGVRFKLLQVLSKRNEELRVSASKRLWLHVHRALNSMGQLMNTWKDVDAF